MTLNDKIYEAIHLEIYKNESDCIDGFQDATNKVEELIDNEIIAFAEWMAKEYWLNSSGKYTQGQTHKELLEIFKRERHGTVV